MNIDQRQPPGTSVKRRHMGGCNGWTHTLWGEFYVDTQTRQAHLSSDISI